jgi:NADH:ubiquinone oxidoreductase subunit K
MNGTGGYMGCFWWNLESRFIFIDSSIHYLENLLYSIHSFVIAVTCIEAKLRVLNRGLRMWIHLRSNSFAIHALVTHDVTVQVAHHQVAVLLHVVVQSCRANIGHAFVRHTYRNKRDQYTRTQRLVEVLLRGICSFVEVLLRGICSFVGCLAARLFAPIHILRCSCSRWTYL